MKSLLLLVYASLFVYSHFAPDSFSYQIHQRFGKSNMTLTDLKLCVAAVCYNQWGKYHTSNPGTGGTGDRGCYDIIKGCSSGYKLDCIFGPCPSDFWVTGDYPCVADSTCHSYCGWGRTDCAFNGKIEMEDYSDWMMEFLDKRVGDILVLGAHHTNARITKVNFYIIAEKGGVEQILADVEALSRLIPLGDKLIEVATESMLPMFSSTQVSDVATMLVHGVRAFDFRPYWYTVDNQLHDYHGGQGIAIEPVLQQILSFVHSHPTELVYVYWSNLLEGNCYNCKTGVAGEVLRLIKKYFGTCEQGLLICKFTITNTLRQTIANKTNILMFSDDTTLMSSPFIFPAYFGSPGNPISNNVRLVGTYYCQNDADILAAGIASDTEAKKFLHNHDTLRLYQWQLTPVENDFIGSLTQHFTGNWQDTANKYGCESLLCLGRVNSVSAFLERNLTAGYVNSNIVLVDFVDQLGNMEAVLKWNRNK